MGLKDYKPTPPFQVGVAQTSSERLVDVNALMPVVEDEDEVEVEVEVEVETSDETPETASSKEGEVVEALTGNINSVLEFAEANPDTLEDLLSAEQAGKSRKRLVRELKALLGGE